jgi:hypothetical protein
MVILEKMKLLPLGEKIKSVIMCRGYKIQVDDELGFTTSDMRPR